jgi:poly(A) polymerase
VLEILARANIKTFPTGIKHGTITARLEGRNYEITSLRRDISCDGRFATVQYTSDWEEDAKRRDFTINALSLSEDGVIYDYTQGLNDLSRQQIRFIGLAAQRIFEDYLRILRFFRFSAYYDQGPIDQLALQACTEQAHNISQLSGERIRSELFKILLSNKAPAILQIMQQAGILDYILPGAIIHYEILAQLIQLELRLNLQPSALLRLTICCLDMESASLDIVTHLLKLSNKEKTYLDYILTHLPQCNPNSSKAEVKELLRQSGPNYYSAIVLSRWAMSLAGSTLAASINHIFQAMFDLPLSWPTPKFPINGNDLLKQGFSGKDVGKSLQKLINYWVESDYQLTKAELTKLLHTL